MALILLLSLVGCSPVPAVDLLTPTAVPDEAFIQDAQGYADQYRS